MNYIKWAWQRVTRGYDDRVLWSLSEYIDPIILAVLKSHREIDGWHPIGITAKKWNKALDVMIAGFQPEPNWSKVSEYKKWKKNRDKALVLFAFYYDSLWS